MTMFTWRKAPLSLKSSQKYLTAHCRPRRVGFERLESRVTLAGDTVTIYAAGQTGQESMELLIDGVSVQSWNNIGGDYSNRVFQSFSYAASSALSPDRIRVAFTNDLYQPGVIDRNLRVDRIQINNTVFESEADTVFSTATYLDADGIQPGFRRSEFLNANGYFQYSMNAGSRIHIFAAGRTGNENVELQIDGTPVAAWSQVAGNIDNRQWIDLTYRAATTVSASQIRVAFTNDFYAPPIDYNVAVDKITVDAIGYESEAPTTLSTGTYVASQNQIATGFWESESLNGNGYFQYAARTWNPGNLGLEKSVYSVSENAGSVAVAVVRSGGSDGQVSLNYRTNYGTAFAGSDYTSQSGVVTFLSGETRKSISIPLLNDSIKESPENFSFVIDNPVGGATLLAPRTATITITDDDLVLPNYSNFTSSNGLTLNGATTITSSTIQLTNQAANRTGSAFYNTPIPINVDTSFTTQFQFQTTGFSSGGSGLTFTLQNVGSNALGGGGASLGYGGIAKSVAIEFDTYQSAGDIDNNHVSIWRDGNMVNSLMTRSSTIDFNSGTPVYVWVDYNGERDSLSMYIASTNAKPTAAFATISIDVPSILGSQAYFGFTAATGSVYNGHRIANWTLNLNRPAGSTPTVPPDLVQETIVSGLIQPTAAQFSADGRNLYIAQKDGIVRVMRDGVLQATPFIDIRTQVNNVSDRGLLDVALHPNFAANPYVYLLFTYDPPEVYQNSGLAASDQVGNRAGRLIRVTADAATNYTTAIPGSQVILLGSNSTWNNFNAFIDSTNDLVAPQGGLNPDGSYVRDFIASDSQSHTVGSLAFSTDGSLFVSIGDGASYNNVDPRATRVQDIDSLSGKILRIDPLTGQGLPSNPFYNNDPNSNRSKVYQSGLRNPFRISVNPQTGRLIVGDVGWTQWEEINTAAAGANFGWPYYEGGSGSSLQTNGYKDLAKAQAFYSSGKTVTSSAFALNHSLEGINAIVLGASYTGNAYPAQYRNSIFFNDLGQGIVRSGTVDSSGRIASVETFATGAKYVVQIFQGVDGNLYFVDLDDGIVGRWTFATQTAVAKAATNSVASISGTSTSSPATKLSAPQPQPTSAPTVTSIVSTSTPATTSTRSSGALMLSSTGSTTASTTKLAVAKSPQPTAASSIESLLALLAKNKLRQTVVAKR